MEQTHEVVQTIAVLNDGVGIVTVSKEARMLLSLFEKMDLVERLNCISALYNKVDKKQSGGDTV
ncbi:MAG: hypothetical protein ACI4TG_07730 [Ruminococcus sp.]